MRNINGSNKSAYHRHAENKIMRLTIKIFGFLVSTTMVFFLLRGAYIPPVLGFSILSFIAGLVIGVSIKDQLFW